MHRLDTFGNRARYNVLTPVFLLAIGLGTPAIGATVSSPTTNYVMGTGDSLINQSQITGLTQPAVSSAGAIESIDNQSGAAIIGGAYEGIYVDGAANSISNEGFISSTDNYAVEVNGNLNSLSNSGTINSYYTGVYVDGSVGSFANAGKITSAEDYGVYVADDVNTFNNSGGINGDEYGVYLDGSAGSFTNSGQITAATDTAVYINDEVGTFTNSGLIKSNDDTGVYIDDSVGSFINSGTIQAQDYGVYINDTVNTFTNTGSIVSNDDYGVYVDDGVGSFTNGGKIDSFDEGVYIDGDVGTLTNTGTVTSHDESGIYVSGSITSFTNSGTIEAYDDGVDVDGPVTTFANSGSITSHDDTGVYIEGPVMTFGNSGQISAYDDGVELEGNVGSFTNSGSITSNDDTGVYIDGSVTSFSSSGKISAYDTGVDIEGAVGTFTNSGSIISNDENGVGIYNGAVQSFVNSGSISGYGFSGKGGAAGDGVYVRDGRVGSFTNSGSIISANETGVDLEYGADTFANSGGIKGHDRGVYLDGSVTSFNNSGTITGEYDEGVDIDGTVGSFINSGKIESGDSSGVYIDGDVGSFVNSGTISGGPSDDGVDVEGAVTTFDNSGTISGYTGVYFDNSSPVVFTDSGEIDGTNGTAIQFGSGDDTLILKTGAKFIGGVNFGGGDDTLDISGYHGNLVLDEFGTLPAGNIVPGDNLHYQSPTQVVIASGDATRYSSQPIQDLVGGVSDLLDVQSDGVAVDNDARDVANYMPSPRQTPAEEATGDALASPAYTTKIWASALGGGSRNDNDADLASRYGGFVVGGQTAVLPGITVGLLGGYARTNLDVDNQQNVTGDVGLAGVYGKADLGAVSVNGSLLGGWGSNNSSRTVNTGTGPQTATGDFSSWFIAPAVGVSIPVLKMDHGRVDVVGTIGYIGGNYGGYTESGSIADMEVGSQTYGVFNTSVALKGMVAIGNINGNEVTLGGQVGLFTVSNINSSNVNFTLPDFANASLGSVSTGTGTSYGVKAGLSLNVPVAQSIDFSAGVNGAARSDGLFGGSGDIKLSAKF